MFVKLPDYPISNQAPREVANEITGPFSEIQSYLPADDLSKFRSLSKANNNAPLKTPHIYCLSANYFSEPSDDEVARYNLLFGTSTKIKLPANITDARLIDLINTGRLDHVTELHLPEFCQLSAESLAYLIEGFDVTEEGVEHHRGLPNLQRLNLPDCEDISITTLVACLKQAPNLKHLNLEGCEQITNEDLQLFEDLPHLEYLNLSRCIHITTDGVEHLAELKSLKTIVLKTCNLPPKLESLEGIPDLQVIRD